MPRVGFETTNPVFERAKTVHASDRAATVIGPLLTERYNFLLFCYIKYSLFPVRTNWRQISVQSLSLPCPRLSAHTRKLRAERITLKCTQFSLMYQLMCKLHIPVQEVCNHQILHSHYAILDYHSSELSRVNKLHERTRK
jgi:hypothetical protein